MVDSLFDQADEAAAAPVRTWRWRDEQANINWVFGMRWLPALGMQGQRALHRNLRQQGIGWAVNHGTAVRLVGVQSTAEPITVTKHSASAAAAFAITHPEGVHALCLSVQGVGVWFVASAQGCVLSDTDRWFETIEQAETFVQRLRERYEQVQFEARQWVLDKQATPNKLDESEASEASEVLNMQVQKPAFLQAAVSGRCRFNRLPSGWAWWPVLVLGVAMLIGGALYGYGYVGGQTKPLVINQEVSLDVSPAMHVHDIEGLLGLFDAWYALPVDPAGWLLHAVNCRVEQDKAVCRAIYQRRVPGADNEGLRRHQPVGWVFEADSLDRAALKRTIQLLRRPLRAHMHVSRVFALTQLQRFSARVSELVLGSTKVIKAGGSAAHAHDNPGGLEPDGLIDPSHRDHAARPVSVEPAASRPISSRGVTLRLALRQVGRLRELNLPFRWQRADLAVVHGAQIDERHGYLMLNLQGDFFETNH